MQKVKLEDPWKVQSLFEFQYFNCPSCEYKDYVIQDFIYHAFENHPESIEYLSNITDGSLEGILCPWNSNEYEAESTIGEFSGEHLKKEADIDISIDIKEEFCDNNDSEICENDNEICEYDNEIYGNDKRYIEI